MFWNLTLKERENYHDFLGNENLIDPRNVTFKIKEFYFGKVYNLIIQFSFQGKKVIYIINMG